ncbi:MAG: SIR2 family NAD-dependent protein deacylase [Prevotella sp.]
MKNIVVLTGAGISAESGLSTFRDSDGLWEQHPVSRVATHEAWEADPVYVNEFYNMLRAKLITALPNDGHRLVAELEKENNVTVITQNVDNLHEMAGSSHVIHLHGELMKVCSSRDVDNPHFIRTLTPPDITVAPGKKAGDGSLLRPYIVFFGEAVPNIEVAAEAVSKADVFIIIGTSLNVYPAAGLVRYVNAGVPIYLIDPKPAMISGVRDVTQIACGAGEGMQRLMKMLKK